ncbi:Ankyrin-2 [Dirofilaria immitis]
MLSVYKLMMICFIIIQCQKLLHCELDLLISNRGLIKNDWVIENEDENCDAVEKAPWSLYFFRGMIFGFLIGLSGGILFQLITI